MSERNCVIPYCDFENIKEGEDAQLMPICACFHCIHVGCFKNLLKNEPEPRCPICRDDFVTKMKKLITENPAEKEEEEEYEIVIPVVAFFPPISMNLLTPRRHVNRKAS